MPSAPVGDTDGPGVPSFVMTGAAAHPVTNKFSERKRISTREPCLRCRETACTIRRRLICIRDDARCLASYVPCPGRGKVEGGAARRVFRHGAPKFAWKMRETAGNDARACSVRSQLAGHHGGRFFACAAMQLHSIC